MQTKLNRIIKISWKPFLSVLLILLVITSFWLLTNKPKETKAGWWNDSWSYRKAITINHTKVAGDLTNFPMLVSLTDTSLGAHAQADGDDIVFVASNGEKLKHEIESFATSTGVLVAWVKIPALSSTQDETIYMYYGNAGAGNQQDAANVWDENYKGIWHFPNNLTSSTSDSTRYNVDGTTAGTDASTTASAKVDGGMLFDGSDDKISLGTQFDIPSLPIVVSAWVKPDDFNNWHTIFAKRDSWDSCNDMRFQFQLNDGIGNVLFGSFSSIAGFEYIPPTGQWTHLLIIANSAGTYLYVNGSYQETQNSISLCNDITSEVSIGLTGDGSDPFDGVLDEVRIATASSSDEWYETEFNNQSDPASFLAAQAEETGPGPVGYWSFDDPACAGQGGAVACDDSGRGNHGTIIGATWQDESLCVSGKCLYFDGTGDTVTVDNTIPVVKTIQMWIYVQSYNLELFYLDDCGGDDSCIFGSIDAIQLTSGIINPIIYLNGNQIAEGSSVSANKWVMLTVTGSSMDMGDNITLGNWTGGEMPFVGKVDEVKLYPYTRTADQIRQDYAAGLAGIGTPHGVSAAFGSASDKWMSDGLVGYWPMDETATTSGAADLSGNGNPGTFYNHASTTAGKFGRGGVFDGTDDYVRVSGDLLGTGSVTICAWLNVAYIASGQALEVIGNGVMGFGAYEDGNNIKVWAITSDSGSHVAASADDSLLENTWQYVCTIRRSSGQASLYIDGVVSGDQNQESGTPATYLNDTNIGSIDGSDWFFRGMIDDVRIYNRALSPDEVRKLYEWAPGPVAHWKFDEKNGATAYDSAASTTFSGGNHGALGGGTAAYRPTWTRGKMGSALEFDGNDDYVNAGSKSNLDDIDKNAGLTIAAWVKPGPGLANNTGSIVAKAASGESGYFYFRINDDTPELIFEKDYSGDDLEVDSDDIIIYDVWQHVAVTWDGSNLASGVDFYINGILSNEGTTNGTGNKNSDAAENLFIGNRDGGGYDFDGLIDDVRIYNYARTQKQILEDMSARGGSASGGDGGLYPVLNLKFDEGKGETAHDESGYGYNGTLYPGTGGTNTATSAMWTLDGKFGKAIEFDGTDDYIEKTSIAGLPTTIGSMSMWVYLKSKPIDPNAYTFLELSDGTSNNRIVFYIDYSQLYIYVTGGGGANVWRWDESNVNIEQWYNFVVTWNTDADNYQVYRDGNLITPDATMTASNPSGINQVNIGSYYNHTNFMYGLIDEVKIYPYALNADEIKADYNRGKAAVMGSTGKANVAATSSNAASLEYCVPGSTDYCAPPVGEWKFDEKTGVTVYDTSGNGNNGTITEATWARGKIGSALSFENPGPRVNSDNELITISTVTVCAWIKPSSDLQITSLVDNIDFEFGVYIWDNPAERLTLTSNHGGTTFYGEQHSLTPEAWQHVCTVRLSNGNATFYINGSQSGDANQDSGTPVNDYPEGLAIGARPDGGGSTFNGLIDEVRVYNYARTPAQIAWEYNRGKPVAQWKFDECSGSTINDSASVWNGGTANNGTLYLGTSGVTATGTCASSSDSFWYNGRTGKVNSAGSFDGTNDYVQVQNSSSLNITGQITLSAWVYPTNTINYWQGIVFKRDPSGGDVDYGLIIEPDGDDFGINIGGDDINHFTEGHDLAEYRWQFIAATFNESTDIINFYLDGIKIFETTETGTIGNNNVPVIIGESMVGENFEGKIDDVKIWNYALTAEQVKMEYSGGAVRFGN